MKLKELLEQYGEYTVPQELIEKLDPPKPQSIWDLKSFDKYFLLYADGVVTEYEWRENGYISNNYRDQGNIFITKEEAEKEAERKEVETLLLKFGGRRLFKNGEENWVIRYNHVQSSFEYGYLNVTQYSSCIYFDTKEQAEKAVQEIGKDRIFKALFEVR